jgi:hypothetical protein
MNDPSRAWIGATFISQAYILAIKAIDLTCVDKSARMSERRVNLGLAVTLDDAAPKNPCVRPRWNGSQSNDQRRSPYRQPTTRAAHPLLIFAHQTRPSILNKIPAANWFSTVPYSMMWVLKRQFARGSSLTAATSHMYMNTMIFI